MGASFAKNSIVGLGYLPIHSLNRNGIIPLKAGTGIPVLRLYCTDRPKVPETNVPDAYHCLHILSILVEDS